MTGSAYQNWLKKEEEWIGAYCSRIRKNSILKVVPLTILLLAVLFGGMALLGGGSTQDLLTGMVGGLFLGLIICAFYLAVLLLQLRPGRYVQKIEQSVKALSANDMEKEFLGREMLAALEGGGTGAFLPDDRAEQQWNPGKGDPDAPLYPAGGQLALCRTGSAE